MTEDPTMADPAVKLTKAQREALSRQRFTKTFGGTITSADARGFSVKVHRATFNRLAALGLIEQTSWSSASSRYAITPAGRALLDALKDEGEGR